MNIPEEFGKYLLLKKLTEDPLGEAFRAGRVGNEGMEQVVLLRVFNGKGLDGEKLWAKIAGRRGVQEILRSPNIGSGVDLGRVRSFPYAAYDYISGKNLAAVFAQAAREHSPVPTDHALLIAERISLALAAAYESRLQDERVLHGFVVPQLVMISNEGETRLLGFEVAPGLRELGGRRLAGRGATPLPVARDPGRRAPEQVRRRLLPGRPLLRAADRRAPPGRAPRGLRRADRRRHAPRRGGAAAGAGGGAAQEEPGAPRPADRRRGDLAQDAGEADDRLQLQPDHVQPRLLHAQPLPRRDRAGEPGDAGREEARAAAAAGGRRRSPWPRPHRASPDPREATGVREGTGTWSGTRAQAATAARRLEEAAVDRPRRGRGDRPGRRRLLPLRAPDGTSQAAGAPAPRRLAHVQPASMPGSVPPPVGSAGAVAAPTPEELQAQIQKMFDARSKDMENKLKGQYDDRIKQLQQQLADSKKTQPAEPGERMKPERTAEKRSRRRRSRPAPPRSPSPPRVAAKTAVPQPGASAAQSALGAANAASERPAQGSPTPPARRAQAQVQVGDLVQPGPGVAAPKLTSGSIPATRRRRSASTGRPRWTSRCWSTSTAGSSMPTASAPRRASGSTRRPWMRPSGRSSSPPPATGCGSRCGPRCG